MERQRIRELSLSGYLLFLSVVAVVFWAALVVRLWSLVSI
jgi:hypothetical protein